MVTLLAPAAENLYTGGYLFNQRAEKTAEADTLVYRILPQPLPRTEELKDFGIEQDSKLLLDSLFFRSPEWVLEVIKKWKAPISLLIHSLPSREPGLGAEESALLRQAEFSCIQACSRIITTSIFMKKLIESEYGTLLPVAAIHPGYSRPSRIGTDPTEGKYRLGKLTWPPGGTRLITISNWTGAKNHRFLLHVLKEVEDLPWQWRIYGAGSPDGSLEDAFQRNTEQLGLQGRIQKGPRLHPDEAGRELEHADIFLFPSLFESYGMILAEALGAGLPCIANRIGGIPEVFGHSEAGILCRPGQTGQWSRSLKKLLLSPSRRERMHRQALLRAADFPSWRETAEHICAFLEVP